ncbi:hypothetical protein E2C01_066359 [Portunus trituberculatus]|uniref:Uncharacterized protein n=1 Tax=Portunus trituberculatus TaxID=210409 RepID=A0A5B7HQ24_PORTR|nr:hypothetical protein [Portunus trituberculatus]
MPQLRTIVVPSAPHIRHTTTPSALLSQYQGAIGYHSASVIVAEHQNRINIVFYHTKLHHKGFTPHYDTLTT